MIKAMFSRKGFAWVLGCAFCGALLGLMGGQAFGSIWAWLAFGVGAGLACALLLFAFNPDLAADGGSPSAAAPAGPAIPEGDVSSKDGSARAGTSGRPRSAPSPVSSAAEAGAASKRSPPRGAGSPAQEPSPEEVVLYKDLLSRVLGNRDTAEALIKYEGQHLSRAEAIRRAIESLERDHRRD